MTNKEQTLKQHQRLALLQQKRTFIHSYDRIICSEQLLRLFLSLPEYPSFRNIISFNPMPDEPDISVINARLISKNQNHITIISALPNAAIPDNLTDVDTIIIPMQGFDRTGNRIGRGGGWYDRFLSLACAENPTIIKLGVCFACLELPFISADAYDIKMDIILTEKEIIRTNDSLLLNSDKKYS